MANRQYPPSGVDAELEEIAHKVIGAAIEVHRHLGPGHKEEAYENALAMELELRNIAYERQKALPVSYKGTKVADTRVDFVVAGRLVVEIKAVDRIDPVFMAQVIAYIVIVNESLGLLINFNVPLLKDENGIRRVIRSKRKLD